MRNGTPDAALLANNPPLPQTFLPTPTPDSDSSETSPQNDQSEHLPGEHSQSQPQPSAHHQYETDACILTLTPEPRRPLTALTIHDGRLFAAHTDGTISEWDLASGEVTRTFSANSSSSNHNANPITTIAAGGRRLFSGSEDGTLKSWSLNSGSLVRSVNAHEGHVTSLCFTKEGRLYSGGSDKTINEWDPRGLRRKWILSGHTRWVLSIVSGGGKLYSAGSDGVIRVWDMATGRCVFLIEDHKDWITSLCLGRDLLYSSCRDGTIRIFDTSTGQCLRTLLGHNNQPVRAVCVAGGKLYSAGDDKAVVEWDVKAGRTVRRFVGHYGAVMALVAGLDGKVFSGGQDGAVRIWDGGVGGIPFGPSSVSADQNHKPSSLPPSPPHSPLMNSSADPFADPPPLHRADSNLSRSDTTLSRHNSALHRSDTLTRPSTISRNHSTLSRSDSVTSSNQYHYPPSSQADDISSLREQLAKAQELLSKQNRLKLRLKSELTASRTEVANLKSEMSSFHSQTERVKDLSEELTAAKELLVTYKSELHYSLETQSVLVEHLLRSSDRVFMDIEMELSGVRRLLEHPFTPLKGHEADGLDDWMSPARVEKCWDSDSEWDSDVELGDGEGEGWWREEGGGWGRFAGKVEQELKSEELVRRSGESVRRSGEEGRDAEGEEEGKGKGRPRHVMSWHVGNRYAVDEDLGGGWDEEEGDGEINVGEDYVHTSHDDVNIDPDDIESVLRPAAVVTAENVLRPTATVMVPNVASAVAKSDVGSKNGRDGASSVGGRRRDRDRERERERDQGRGGDDDYFDPITGFHESAPARYASSDAGDIDHLDHAPNSHQPHTLAAAAAAAQYRSANPAAAAAAAKLLATTNRGGSPSLDPYLREHEQKQHERKAHTGADRGGAGAGSWLRNIGNWVESLGEQLAPPIVRDPVSGRDARRAGSVRDANPARAPVVKVRSSDVWRFDEGAGGRKSLDRVESIGTPSHEVGTPLATPPVQMEDMDAILRSAAYVGPPPLIPTPPIATANIDGMNMARAPTPQGPVPIPSRRITVAAPSRGGAAADEEDRPPVLKPRTVSMRVGSLTFGTASGSAAAGGYQSFPDVNTAGMIGNLPMASPTFGVYEAEWTGIPSAGSAVVSEPERWETGRVDVIREADEDQQSAAVGVVGKGTDDVPLVGAGDWADDDALRALADLEGVEVPDAATVDNGNAVDIKGKGKMPEDDMLMDPLNAARVDLEGRDESVARMPQVDLSSAKSPPAKPPLRRSRTVSVPQHDSGIFIDGAGLGEASTGSVEASPVANLPPAPGTPPQKPTRLIRSNTTVGPNRGLRPDPIITNTTSVTISSPSRTQEMTVKPYAVPQALSHPQPNPHPQQHLQNPALAGHPEGSALDKLTSALENAVSDPWGMVSGWLRSSRAEAGTAGGGERVYSTGLEGGRGGAYGSMGSVERKKTVG
ncbi:hypothetical protein HK097_011221 [Rhizophlyctis rosea]|uniref:WD40 repeat-like protein n=1 Tax=Rhizophlyctis rosea TaxID=64517 RepID=A0AAD5S6Q7_9FUNG|nr:hypothetical protein HK097_011221 [Rhizophlyctis rosea]